MARHELLDPGEGIAHPLANGKTLCIGNPAVKAHLKYGDDMNSIVIGCGK